METTTGNLRDLNLNAADDEEEDEEAHVRLAFPQGLVRQRASGDKAWRRRLAQRRGGHFEPENRTEPNRIQITGIVGLFGFWVWLRFR
jgi:hypothetical protein